jgi:thioredoxin 1
VNEGDPAPASTNSGHIVYQPVSGRSARFERGIQIGNPVADMMDSGSSAGQELGDGAVRVVRFEKLYLSVAEGKRRDGGAIGRFECVGVETQHLTIKGERRCQIWYGDPNMSDPGAIGHAIPPRNGSSTQQSEENNIMAATNTLAVHVTDASFASEIEQANGLVLVDFWATWCGPCQIVAPVLEQLAGEYAGRAKVAKVDVDSNQRTAMRFNVRSIPSILFFKNGQHVDTVVGAVPKATLEGKIKQHLQ